jgi:hypothetical protein
MTIIDFPELLAPLDGKRKKNLVEAFFQWFEETIDLSITVRFPLEFGNLN